jgi:hypothetical protein
MATQNITASIDLHTEFGLGIDTLKAKIGERPEQTWKNILSKLLKRHNWWQISWEQDGSKFTIGETHWTETNHDFNNSIEIEKI